MRVISGKYRGRKLYSPSNEHVRPTTDRIKETLFNILQRDIVDAVVVDLFAGSGALGIESISRGAKEVTFVDKDRDSIALINMNLNGINGNFRVVQNDFLSYLKSLHTKADIIFIDPPYKTDLGEIAINAILDLDILSDVGIIVYEHGADKKFAFSRSGYKARTKFMGTSVVEFVTRHSVALVTGSFDPITKGHEALIDAACEKFSEVVVACLVNPEKTYFFTAEERLEIVKAAISDKTKTRAIFSEKSAVDVAKEVGADKLVRGLRGKGDCAYELEMAAYNRALGFETEFIKIENMNNISSTLTREQLGVDDFENIPDTAVGTVKKLINRHKIS